MYHYYVYYTIAIIIVIILCIILLWAIVGKFQIILPNRVFVTLSVESMSGGDFEGKVFLLQFEVAHAEAGGK